MTRAEVQQVYRQMDHARDMAMRATSVRAKSEYDAEHRRLWLTIRPYVTGAKLYAVRA